MRDAALNAITLSCLAGMIGLCGCHQRPAVPAEPATISGLLVGKVVAEPMRATTRAVGTLQATESVLLSAQTTGRVVSVLAHEGDKVAAGQVLITLEDAQAQSDLNRARADVAATQHAVELAQTQQSLADSTLARYKVLRDRKSISPQEFDEVSQRDEAAREQVQSTKAQLAAAEASVTSSRTVAGYARIAAPFSGVLTARLVDPGAMASAGVGLLQIDKAGPLELHIPVDESLLPAVQEGSSIPVHVGADPESSLSGRVSKILPAADPASHTFVVKIALPAAKDLRAGMFGTANIASGTRTAILVPASALLTHGSLHGVWVLDSNNIATLRYITVGTQEGRLVEALSGLSGGENVVLNPGDLELGGQRIATATADGVQR